MSDICGQRTVLHGQGWGKTHKHGFLFLFCLCNDQLVTTTSESTLGSEVLSVYSWTGAEKGGMSECRRVTNIVSHKGGCEGNTTTD